MVNVTVDTDTGQDGHVFRSETVYPTTTNGPTFSNDYLGPRLELGQVRGRFQYPTSTPTGFAYNNEDNRPYILFKGITIPQGSNIDDATLTVFGVNSTTSISFTNRVYGRKTASPTSYTTTTQYGTGIFTRTDNATAFGQFTLTTGDAGTSLSGNQKDIDMQATIQELVTAFDYNNDNMMFIVKSQPIVLTPTTVSPTVTQSQAGFITESQTPTLVINYSEAVVAPCTSDFCEDFEDYALSKLPTFRDDFTVHGTQAEADTAWVSTDNTRLRANITNDNLDFNMNQASTNLAIGHDLGAGNVSNEKWVLHGKVNFTTLTADTNTRIYFGLSDSSQATAINASADRIFMLLRFSTGTKDYASVDTDGAGEGAQDDNITFTFLTGVDYYLTVQRDSLLSYHVEIFTDKARTVSLGRADGVCTSTTDALRHIIIQNVNATLNTTMTGTIDDVEFWNEGQQGDVTFQEDFSLRTGEVEDDFASDNFVETGTKNLVSGGVMNFDFDRDSTNHKTVRDLTSTSDEKWAMRWKQTNATVTQTGTPSTLGYIGVIDSDNTVPANGTNDFIGLEIAVDDVNNVIRLVDANGSVLSSGTVRYTFTETNAVNTRYWEVKRLSSTEIIASVYSDAQYSTLIETSGVQTTVAGVSGLRYLTVVTDNQATSVSAHAGTLDDMKFYDGVSVLTDWQGRRIEGVVNTNAERIDWTMIRNGTDNRVVRDFGAGNVSDTKWTLRFRYHLNAGGVQTTASGANYQVLFQDTDVGQSATNDTIGFSMQNTVGSPARTFVLLARAGGASNGFATSADAIIPFGGEVDLFVELKRLSETSVIVNVYNDNLYTDLFTTLSITTTSATNGLRYLACSAGDDVTAWDGTETGFIDDIEFYNEVSVAKTPIKTTDEDFEDSFVEDNWTDTGAQHGVNTSTQVIDWDSARLAEAINQTTFDLETIFPEGVNPVKWGLRFKFKYDAVTAGGASSQFAVFLSSLGANNSSEVAQDHATYKLQGNTPPTYSGMIDDASQIFTGSAVAMGSDIIPVGEFAYAEMTRNGTLFTWATYSDPDFTQLVGNGKLSVNDNSVLSGLRYLKIGRRDGGATAFTFNGTLDDIKFWNGALPTEHGSKWVEVNVP